MEDEKRVGNCVEAYGIGAGMSKRKPPRQLKKAHSGKPERAADHRHKGDAGGSGRAAGGGLWLYGTHAVESALRNPSRTCHRLLVSGSASEQAAKWLSHINLPRPSPEQVTRDQIDAVLPPGAVHQGIALQVAPLNDLHLEDLIKRIASDAVSTIGVIDQGSDPRNVGAVLRSAAAFGLDALIVQDKHAPDATGAMAKSASGALEDVPMVRVTNLARALDQLKDAGYWIVGLAGETDQSLAKFSWPKRSVIILGAEDTGMRRLTREHCDYIVRIPMSPTMESLNLSNAAAIAFYEAFKARS